MRVTPKDLVKFILQYRGFRAFVDWSISDLIKCILWCSSQGTLAYCASNIDGITGVMLGEIREGNRFYIINILSTKRNMPFFIRYILQHFPQCTHIATLRHGRYYKEYPLTERYISKFINLTK